MSNYLNSKLKPFYQKYKTLQSLKANSGLNDTQKEELIKISALLIDSLIQDNSKLKKQKLIDDYTISSFDRNVK